MLGYAVGAGTATHRTLARAASLTPSTPTSCVANTDYAGLPPTA